VENNKTVSARKKFFIKRSSIKLKL